MAYEWPMDELVGGKCVPRDGLAWLDSGTLEDGCAVDWLEGVYGCDDGVECGGCDG